MRSLAGAFRGELESPLSSEVAVIFITVDHPDLQVPIRINTDIVDYVYGGNTFTGTGIYRTLSDDEQVPRLQVSFVNVDRTIGQTILALTTPPRIKLELLAKSDFDEASRAIRSARPRSNTPPRTSTCATSAVTP
jgi:hypothetical protein